MVFFFYPEIYPCKNIIEGGSFDQIRVLKKKNKRFSNCIIRTWNIIRKSASGDVRTGRINATKNRLGISVSKKSRE